MKRESESSDKNIVGAFLIIGFGTILLLNNFGTLPWSIWEVIFRFWPVLLILWGLELVFSRNIICNLLVNIIGILLFFFILSYAVSLFNQNYNNFMLKNFPTIWHRIKTDIPQSSFKGQNKVFRCNPFDSTCEVIVK